MTCKNIRGCKRWRVSEIEEINQLTWAYEVPGIGLCRHIITLMYHLTLSNAGLLKKKKLYIFTVYYTKLGLGLNHVLKLNIIHYLHSGDFHFL